MQHYDVLACPAASFACRRVLTTGRAPRLAAAVREKVSAEVSASVWQSSCFYAHRNADGTLAEAPELRTALTAEGRGEVIREVSKYSSTAAVPPVTAVGGHQLATLCMGLLRVATYTATSRRLVGAVGSHLF